MAFIVNPLSRRFGYSRFWTNVWSSTSLVNYGFVSFVDNNIFKLLKWWLEKWSKIFSYYWFNTYFFRNESSFDIILCYGNQFRDQITFKKLQSNIYFDVNAYSILDHYCKICNNLRYKQDIVIYIKFLKVLFLYSAFIKDIYLDSEGVQLYKYIKNYFQMYFNSTFGISYLKLLLHRFCFKKIRVWFMKNKTEIVTAFYLVRFLKPKLIQKFPVYLILSILLRTLKIINNKYDFYNGIKICVAGRFTRKERKLFWWNSTGYLGLSNFTVNSDYNYDSVILLNSLCGIKIWLNSKYNFNESTFKLLT